METFDQELDLMFFEAQQSFNDKKRVWQVSNGLPTERQEMQFGLLMDQVRLTDEVDQYYRTEMRGASYERATELIDELFEILEQFQDDPRKQFLQRVKVSCKLKLVA
jgi:hypothetical protein